MNGNLLTLHSSTMPGFCGASIFKALLTELELGGSTDIASAVKRTYPRPGPGRQSFPLIIPTGTIGYTHLREIAHSIVPLDLETSIVFFQESHNDMPMIHPDHTLFSWCNKHLHENRRTKDYVAGLVKATSNLVFATTKQRCLASGIPVLDPTVVYSVHLGTRGSEQNLSDGKYMMHCRVEIGNPSQLIQTAWQLMQLLYHISVPFDSLTTSVPALKGMIEGYLHLGNAYFRDTPERVRVIKHARFAEVGLDKVFTRDLILYDSPLFLNRNYNHYCASMSWSKAPNLDSFS